MTRFLPARAVAGVAVAAVGLSGWAAASIAGAHTASPAGTRASTLHVGLASVAGQDVRIIETASGRPVYLLSGDSARHPQCGAACRGIWPAVSAVHPTARGVRGKLGVWVHNGIHQVTLDGHPLYTFSYDSSGAKATGEGIRSFGGEWFALSPAGRRVQPAQTPSAPGGTAPTTTTPGVSTTTGASTSTTSSTTTAETTPTTPTTPGYSYSTPTATPTTTTTSNGPYSN